MGSKKKTPARKKESLRSMMEGEAANERNAAAIAHGLDKKRKAPAKKK